MASLVREGINQILTNEGFEIPEPEIYKSRAGHPTTFRLSQEAHDMLTNSASTLGWTKKRVVEVGIRLVAGKEVPKIAPERLIVLPARDGWRVYRGDVHLGSFGTEGQAERWAKKLET